MPQKLKEAKTILSTYSKDSFIDIESGYSGTWYESDYGEVPQKWLLIKSEQAGKREKHTQKKTILKNTQASMKSFKKLCQKTYACQSDALSALSEWERKQNYLRVSEPFIIEQLIYQTKGRPKKDAVGTIAYKITGQLFTSLKQKQIKEDKKGLFILSTNDCSRELSMRDMLANYKSQQSVERGFRFLKSPDFLVSSLYLKKPERIEALLMVMTCCLMIYAALEHLIRRELMAKNLFFPDMKKKPTQKPTAKWIFWCFIGIHEISINSETTGILNIKEHHKVILNCLGDRYWDVYS